MPLKTACFPFFSKNFGLTFITKDGTRMSAQSRHSRIEKMIRNAKVLRIINPEKNSTANPRMTEKPLMAIPLPVVVSVFLIAVE